MPTHTKSNTKAKILIDTHEGVSPQKLLEEKNEEIKRLTKKLKQKNKILQQIIKLLLEDDDFANHENIKTFADKTSNADIDDKTSNEDIDDKIESTTPTNIITKNDIINLFKKNVKGKKFEKNPSDKNCGSEGHWLEKLMGLKLNSNNAPDIGGFEMKKYSKKISFGDWSASEYLFSDKTPFLDKFNKQHISMTRSDFLKIFGTKKDNSRYSWSGACIPQYGKWNSSGQKLDIDNDNNIIALYSYANDKRKNIIIPDNIKKNILCVAVWSNTKIEKHVDSKFNQKGFFVCKKDKDNYYQNICFGPPIRFETFISNIKNNKIFFDSGMYEGNSRLYSQWRANNKFWDDLIVEEY